MSFTGGFETSEHQDLRESTTATNSLIVLGMLAPAQHIVYVPAPRGGVVGPLSTRLAQL